MDHIDIEKRKTISFFYLCFEIYVQLLIFVVHDLGVFLFQAMKVYNLPWSLETAVAVPDGDSSSTNSKIGDSSLAKGLFK